MKPYLSWKPIPTTSGNRRWILYDSRPCFVEILYEGRYQRCTKVVTYFVARRLVKNNKKPELKPRILFCKIDQKVEFNKLNRPVSNQNQAEKKFYFRLPFKQCICGAYQIMKALDETCQRELGWQYWCYECGRKDLDVWGTEANISLAKKMTEPKRPVGRPPTVEGSIQKIGLTELKRRLLASGKFTEEELNNL